MYEEVSKSFCKKFFILNYNQNYNTYKHRIGEKIDILTLI